MRTIDLEKMDINDLRRLAIQKGLTTTKKSEIIKQIADDAPQSNGQEAMGTASSIIENALHHVVQANRPSKDLIRESIFVFYNVCNPTS